MTAVLREQISLEKMMTVTLGTIVIFWHAGIQSWPLLHNKPYYPVPESNIIFNLLYSMGMHISGR
ncbi:hypothetical protein ACYULU_11540 [Breznakiellaceae bacterium SP9]